MFYVLFNQLMMYMYVHVQCLVRMTAAPCYLATCGELLCCCEQCTCTNHFLYLYITHETVYQALSNWKLLEITGDCWRLLEITGKITGDYRKSLETAGDYWRLLEKLLEITGNHWSLLAITGDYYYIPSISFSVSGKDLNILCISSFL